VTRPFTQYSRSTHLAVERSETLVRTDSRNARVLVRLRAACGRWMYDDGQFVETAQEVTCANCQRALAQKEKHGEDGKSLHPKG
jgi:hypothetical protein